MSKISSAINKTKQWFYNKRQQLFTAIFVLIFAIVAWILFQLVFITICILAISQVAFCLISGEPNKGLGNLGKVLSEYFISYFSQIIRFLTYSSSNRPFPFTSIDRQEDNKQQTDK